MCSFLDSLKLLTGELYVQAQNMFDDKMFSQLLGIIDLAVKEAIVTNDNFETEFVSRFSVSKTSPSYPLVLS